MEGMKTIAPIIRATLNTSSWLKSSDIVLNPIYNLMYIKTISLH